MYAQVLSGSLQGIDGELVTVETDLARGLPAFALVGLPDAAVREARERIRSAIINSGYGFPLKRITVNLSPANTKKEGTHLDLPIAVSLLMAEGEMEEEGIREFAFLGELSLDGKVKPIKGALPLVIGLRQAGIGKLILPENNRNEVTALKGMEFYPVGHLAEVVEHFRKRRPIERWKPNTGETLRCDVGDFSDIAGQEGAKRSFQISAAAGHSLLLVGPPGSGKTIMTRKVPGILPPLTDEESLEVTQIYSVAGRLPEGGGAINERPFRAPHHTISTAALAGGGSKPRPGEISLAHHGVLFLDELLEFRRSSLETLRQPMEDKKITITRASGNVTFPADFLLIAACNPCPCGYFGDPIRPCTCSIGQIRSYRSKLSGPLMDRVDMHLEVRPVSYEELSMQEHRISKKIGKSTKEMREEVGQARRIQKERYRGKEIASNSQLTPLQIKQYCRMDKGAEELLKDAFQKLGFSARAYQKILMLARTISDLDGAMQIGEPQIAEAIRYRCLDRPLLL